MVLGDGGQRHEGDQDESGDEPPKGATQAAGHGVIFDTSFAQRQDAALFIRIGKLQDSSVEALREGIGEKGKGQQHTVGVRVFG